MGIQIIRQHVVFLSSSPIDGQHINLSAVINGKVMPRPYLYTHNAVSIGHDKGSSQFSGQG